MKKRTGIVVLCLSMILTACTSPFAKEEAPEDIEIELSKSKVTIEEGEEFEIEIENFDDLEKVKVSIEDDDIADCDIDDEIITITGLEEGKTTLTVSARNAEDETVTIKVEEGEAGGVTVVEPVTPNDPDKEPDGEVRYERTVGDYYVAEYHLDRTVWSTMEDDDSDFTSDMVNFMTDLDIVMPMYLAFTHDDSFSGTATMTIDYEGFCDSFVYALSDDENYEKFITIILEAEGYDLSDPDTKQQMLDALKDQKSDFIDMMSESIIGSGDSSDKSYELTWSLDGTVLSLTGDNATRTATLENDDTITLFFSAEDMGNSEMFGDGVTMTFVPVEN